MKKVFDGVVVSDKMTKTVVVKVSRITKHPIYKKLMRRDSRIKADTANFSANVGDRVKIIETKPISLDKHFKILEVIKRGSA